MFKERVREYGRLGGDTKTTSTIRSDHSAVIQVQVYNHFFLLLLGKG